MAAADWWIVLMGVVFVAVIAYTDRRDDVSEGIPALIATVAFLALGAIGGLDPGVDTIGLLALFLGLSVFRMWRERSSSVR